MEVEVEVAEQRHVGGACGAHLDVEEERVAAVAAGGIGLRPFADHGRRAVVRVGGIGGAVAHHVAHALGVAAQNVVRLGEHKAVELVGADCGRGAGQAPPRLLQVVRVDGHQERGGGDVLQAAPRLDVHHAACQVSTTEHMSHGASQVWIREARGEGVPGVLGICMLEYCEFSCMAAHT